MSGAEAAGPPSLVRDGRATWRLVLEGAEALGPAGEEMTLAELIEYVQSIDPTRARTSIQPIVQGMTQGTRSAPRSPCGQVLRRVARGRYVLDPGPPQHESVIVDGDRSSKPHPAVPGRGTARASPGAARLRRIEGRVDELMTHFDDYVDLYDRDVPFRRSGQYELHRQTIDRRRLYDNVFDAIQDAAYTELLHRTLLAWGIGKRASVLCPLPVFRQILQEASEALAKLDGAAIDAAAEPLGHQVWTVVGGLPIVDNISRIVPGTKAVHHLLPDLVPPMDRAWTGRFFEWWPADLQQNQERTFRSAWEQFCRIAEATSPGRLVGDGWRTSSTKILDNAVVAYGMR